MVKEIEHSDHFDNVENTNLQENPRSRNNYEEDSKLTTLDEKKGKKIRNFHS